MDRPNLISFYDISSGPLFATYAPNPWKTRYALNFKGVHYKTEWIDLPDIRATRMRLGTPPNRILNGVDLYTLPIIQDHSNGGEVVGDTFDIAMYLDRIYSDEPMLLPGSSLGLSKSFNVQIDAVFTNCILLFSHGMPLNPARREETITMFESRGFGMKWGDMTVTGEGRKAMWEKLKEGLEPIAKAYGLTQGSFLMGDVPSYPDLIVGAWLQMAMRTSGKEEWEEMRTWHGGLWAALHNGLEKYAQIK